MIAVPGDLKYAKSHEWVKVEGENGTMGLTSFAVVRKHLPDLLLRNRQCALMACAVVRCCLMKVLAVFLLNVA